MGLSSCACQGNTKAVCQALFPCPCLCLCLCPPEFLAQKNATQLAEKGFVKRRGAKGLRKNNLVELALRFSVDLAAND